MDKVKEISSKELSEIVVQGMLEKKAHNVVVMDLKGVKNSVADYFVICSGNSDTQVDAISSSVDEEVSKNASQNPWHKEGFQNKEWVLLDYVDVVAHVFLKDKRDFYNLEGLWGDAVTTKVEEAS